MYIVFRRALVAVTLLAGIGLALRPLWAGPGAAHFAAPHQTRIRSVVSRMELNSRVPESAIKVLHLAVPTTVYACVTSPACDGTKSAPIDYCYNSGGYQCTAYGCSYVGGQNLCQSYSANTCTVPGVGTISCENSKNVTCQ
jgi:hypothetical protein